MQFGVTTVAGRWLSTIGAVWRARSPSIYDLGRWGLEFRPGTTDSFVIKEIWEKNEYFLDGGRIEIDGPIVDVGAHIGAFSVKASLLFPKQRIVAVEPVPANYALLRRNLARNHCRSVTPVNAAVTAKTGGTIPVYLDPRNTGGHSTAVAVSETSVLARTISFGDLVSSHRLSGIGFLKMDCEGGEWEIIRSPSFQALAGSIRNFVLEYHPVEGHDLDELRSLLGDHGLELTAHKDGYFPGQGTALFQRPSSR